MKRTILITILLLAGLATASAQDTIAGDWSAKFRNTRLWLRLERDSFWGRGSNYSETVHLSDLKGLDVSVRHSESAEVKFEYPCDAGIFFFVGVFRNGKGFGEFRFEPNKEYISALKKMGYDDLSMSRLVEFRIHGVTPGFIEAIQNLEFNDLAASRLVEMKIHGIY